jgi:hypothetical protein
MQRPDQYKGMVVDTTIQAWAFDLAWAAGMYAAAITPA